MGACLSVLCVCSVFVKELGELMKIGICFPCEILDFFQEIDDFSMVVASECSRLMTCICIQSAIVTEWKLLS